MARTLLCLLCVSACSTDDQPFVYELRFAPGAASIDVDGITNPDAVSFELDSYDEARAQFRVPVTVTVDRATSQVELSPGFCADEVAPQHPDLGQLLFERVSYGVMTQRAPLLFVTSYECRGTKLAVTTSP